MRKLLFGFLVLAAAGFARPAIADTLTVYVYPAPLKIDWRSPAALAWSSLIADNIKDSALRNIHSIGHMNLDLECGASAELPGGARIVTGQTNSDNSEMSTELRKLGYGLGVSLAAHSGRWETKEEIEADLPVRFKRGSIAFMRFAIQPATCQRVVEYLKEYRERGYDKIYGGLSHRPRNGEGAGCAAFAESVLEVAGLMTSELTASWAQSIFIPLSLIGGPITGKKVSVVKLLFSSAAARWNGSREGSYPLTFWDPYLAYRWIKDASKAPSEFGGMPYVPVKVGKAKGLAIDATGVQTPNEPFWYEQQLASAK